MRQSDGTYIVNTAEIGAQIRGFKGATPVRIYIKKNRIQQVEALPNQETPQYMDRAKAVLKHYKGAKLQKAKTQQVDAVTGATYTSSALKENVRIGVEYFLKHQRRP